MSQNMRECNIKSNEWLQWFAQNGYGRRWIEVQSTIQSISIELDQNALFRYSLAVKAAIDTPQVWSHPLSLSG